MQLFPTSLVRGNAGAAFRRRDSEGMMETNFIRGNVVLLICNDAVTTLRDLIARLVHLHANSPNIEVVQGSKALGETLEKGGIGALIELSCDYAKRSNQSFDDPLNPLALEGRRLVSFLVDRFHPFIGKTDVVGLAASTLISAGPQDRTQNLSYQQLPGFTALQTIRADIAKIGMVPVTDPEVTRILAASKTNRRQSPNVANSCSAELSIYAQQRRLTNLIDGLRKTLERGGSAAELAELQSIFTREVGEAITNAEKIMEMAGGFNTVIGLFADDFETVIGEPEVSVALRALAEID